MSNQPFTFPPPESAPKRRVWPWIAGGIGTMTLLCCGAGIIGAATEQNAAVVINTPAATTPVATPSITKSMATITPKPITKPKPTYQALSERQWKLIAKNPDAYIGNTYIVYGVVTQFDSATGDDTFRANVAHRNMSNSFDYEINTLLTGSTSQLKNLVEDDEFRANVTVVGSFSYDTQIGGNTTAPRLQVDAIKIL